MNSPTSHYSLIELLQSPAAVLNQAGEVTRLNQAWRDQIDLPADNESHPQWSELFHPHERDTVLDHLQTAKATQQTVHFESRLQKQHGVEHWFMFCLQKDETAGGWLCLGINIHDLKTKQAQLEQQTRIQTSMLDVSVDCIKLIALDGTLVHVNRSGCRILGICGDAGFGMPWGSLLPKEVQAAAEQALAQARAGQFVRFVGRSLLPEQRMQRWENLLTPLLDEDGQTTAILCVSREVTTEHDALESAKQSEARFAIAARVGGLGIWDYDVANDLLYCDDIWYQIMGRDAAIPVTSLAEFREWIHPDDAERATEVENTATELVEMDKDYSITFRIIRPDGDVRWIRSAACLVQDSHGDVVRAVGFVTDITNERHAELALLEANQTLNQEKKSLAKQSLEDPLTGIANRRCLDNELPQMCARTQQTGETICMVMADIDRFKLFNDRYGHLSGDVALRKVAQALQSIARQTDLVARYGGEEFALVMLGVSDPSPILSRFASVVAELGIQHEDSSTGVLTVSSGCVVMGPDLLPTPQDLISEADKALYQAKTAGRNRFVIHDLTNGSNAPSLAIASPEKNQSATD